MHSVAYFIASLSALALFFVALMLAESALYVLTGHAVSIWAMVLAALAAAFFYSPLVHGMQRLIDSLFFKRHVDTQAAIQALGAGDLAALPLENIESALLERICAICYRNRAVLDERFDEEGEVFRYPVDAPVPIYGGASSTDYDVILPIERREGVSWLYLGPRIDNWPTDDDELKSLKSLSRFAAMSLEHARLSHQQAQEARLDSLSRVAGQLHSHDLKNRLHDLSFLAHHIGSGKLDEEDARRLVTAIRKVVGRMQTLIQRMADPQSPIDPAFSACDIASLLKHSIDNRLWPEGIRLHCQIPALPVVRADGPMLQGVFENLFDNAMQAMQKQGDLHIEAHSNHEHVEVRVRDTGQGIPKAFLEHRLFRLFATSKEDGLGIGLFLSKRIVETHGGTITAESEGEGKGSTFIVRLPLWQHHQKESKEVRA